jgi:hypothetical protein
VNKYDIIKVPGMVNLPALPHTHSNWGTLGPWWQSGSSHVPLTISLAQLTCVCAQISFSVVMVSRQLPMTMVSVHYICPGL